MQIKIDKPLKRYSNKIFIFTFSGAFEMSYILRVSKWTAAGPQTSKSVSERDPVNAESVLIRLLDTDLNKRNHRTIARRNMVDI